MHPHRGFCLPIFKHFAKAWCFFYAVLAQMEERRSPKPDAAGSSPANGAIAEGSAYPVQRPIADREQREQTVVCPNTGRWCGRWSISIHALREEGDFALLSPCKPPCNFYPRPPRGGRPHDQAVGIGEGQISIHALREEGDQLRGDAGGLKLLFLSTPSARRATGPPVRSL